MSYQPYRYQRRPVLLQRKHKLHIFKWTVGALIVWTLTSNLKYSQQGNPLPHILHYVMLALFGYGIYVVARRYMSTQHNNRRTNIPHANGPSVMDHLRALISSRPSVPKIPLYELNPSEFEQAVGTILTAYGFRDMHVVGGSGDLTADLLGHTPNGESVIVQCKRYAPHHHVGTPEMQQFIGMAYTYHHADRAVYATTSYFSRQAMELADKYHIKLMDGKLLDELAARCNM